MIVAAIVLFVVAAAIAGTAGAAAAGILGPNHVAGIRIPALLASPEAWRIGHRRALLPLAVAAVIAVAAGIVCLVRPDSVGVLVVAILLIVALIAFAVVRAGRAALDVEG
ncbi:hypothetical protein AS850_15360 [Frondihabitans sp. 762G35]|uniref:SdpI family protein n=1 Tax=Frondihabitans sp. 762G35 TaxID=1446794 RepID=UPI000D20127F|nr:SdpI family protein [Frondihabitans sp. 762G35]ARC58464.1 hypothetical protein AS850_15360 [Frondihabitans sp. 762G35]